MKNIKQARDIFFILLHLTGKSFSIVFCAEGDVVAGKSRVHNESNCVLLYECNFTALNNNCTGIRI